MATVPTPEDNARRVLTVFNHFNSQSGRVLQANSLVSLFAKQGWEISALASGLESAAEQGWIEQQTPSGAFKLTDAGFAEM
jgi:DNA-binding transcriptional regulator PaaX